MCSPKASTASPGCGGGRRPESRRLDDLRKTLQKHMLVWIGVVATLLGAYEHWEPAHGEAGGRGLTALGLPNSPMDIVQCLLLLGGLTGLAAIAFRYHRHERAHDERARFDYRALGEGLRVQFYWLLTGGGRAVSAEYMQRQRGELDWIRYVMASTAFPFAEHWRTGFQALGKADKIHLFRAALHAWVLAQGKWYRDTAASTKVAMDRCHHWGWSFLAAGVISIIGHLLAELLLPVEHYLHDHGHHAAGWLALPGVLLVGWHLWRARTVKEGEHSVRQSKETGQPSVDPPQPAHHPASIEPHSAAHGPAHRNFCVWLFSRGSLAWGRGLIIAGAVLLLAWGFDHIPLAWPGFHNWWLILTSTTLLTGGLCLAWSERSFHAETHRTYTSMQDLFSCAGRRLQRLLLQYEQTTDAALEARYLQEIQFIYHQLGCEALDEHAEWLILHRARPLEPFLCA